MSKDDSKIRVQSNHYANLWPCVNELVARLQSSGITVGFVDKLPVREIDNAIDNHFALRQELKRLRKILEDRTIQFRVIQKRVLNRFKDKNPSPLNNLDILLNHTYG